jgi:transcriptional regulator with XRE-family HTH domain
MYGKIIKQLRKNAGLNQADLAQMVGVSRPNISFWENAVYPPLEAIDKICKVFGIELWQFFTYEGSDPQAGILPERYASLKNEIMQLNNEEYEDLMNIIAIFMKKHAPRPEQAQKAAYNAIVNYTERFLRIM